MSTGQLGTARFCEATPSFTRRRGDEETTAKDEGVRAGVRPIPAELRSRRQATPGQGETVSKRISTEGEVQCLHTDPHRAGSWEFHSDSYGRFGRSLEASAELHLSAGSGSGGSMRKRKLILWDTMFIELHGP